MSKVVDEIVEDLIDVLHKHLKELASYETYGENDHLLKRKVGSYVQVTLWLLNDLKENHTIREM